MNYAFSELVHSIFSLTALIGVVGISSFVVLNLNPVPQKEIPTTTGPNIAGVSTNNQPLNFLNMAIESEKYKTRLTTSPGKIEYTAGFSAGVEGEIKDNFLKIQNTGNNNGAFQIEAQIPAELRNKISIRIEDQNDVIILNSFVARKISVDSNSERNFRISYIFEESINYPFEISFKIIN